MVPSMKRLNTTKTILILSKQYWCIMSRLKLIAFRLGIVFLQIFYAGLKLLKSEKRYLFITKLAENPPLDFVVLKAALEEAQPDYQIVMLCRTMDNKFSYIFHMFKQMYYLATSEVVFLERSCLVVHVLRHKESLRVVQMWHALGNMKKFGYTSLDTEEGQPEKLAEAARMHEGYTDILISSFEFIDDYAEGFGVDPAIIREIPLPRVDLLKSNEYKKQKRDEILQAIPQLKTKRTILYCPTFRKDESKNTIHKIQDLINRIDFEKFNFVYKPHPLSKLVVKDERIIENEFSTFDMLFVADIVLSDYSTVIYEAGLLDLPVYLYAYDWEEYQGRREYNIDFEHEVPSFFDGHAEAIVVAIEEDRFDHGAFQEFVQRNIKLPRQGTCCDAIIKLVTHS